MMNAMDANGIIVEMKINHVKSASGTQRKKLMLISGKESMMSRFNVIQFSADNRDLTIFEAIIKAYNQGRKDVVDELNEAIDQDDAEEVYHE